MVTPYFEAPPRTLCYLPLPKITEVATQLLGTAPVCHATRVEALFRFLDIPLTHKQFNDHCTQRLEKLGGNFAFKTLPFTYNNL